MDTILKWLNLSLYSPGVKLTNAQTLSTKVKENPEKEIEYRFLMNSKKVVLRTRKKQIEKLD